ncbi:hypothetical protein QKU58_gp141 [Pyramimonas orientalis virus]|uniref:Tubulin-tyrosine ligase family protein n=1 Tax=Pyramimonas orientalis virus 01B TaxID=3134525 RepID=A0A7L9AYE1_9VIRU|nr:hypothetical protein QKU58_gp141 [Pyramimonas orientalis virus]QOI90190.1 hypothetical protein HWQ62_00053 [Pyramimonas orientalis virus]
MRRYYIVFILLCVLYVFSFISNYRASNTLLYYRFDDKMSTRSSIQIIEPFNTLLKKYTIDASDSYREADILFFTLLTDYHKMYPTLIKIHKPLFIYSLRTIDQLANKATLHTILSINKRLLHLYTPKTYILNNTSQYNRLLQDFDENKLYILKKNLQRQKGCTLTNNLDYVKTAHRDNYVVCQELLQNPYTIRGHKINIRQYLVVIVKEKCKFSLYNDGFMYYTPKQFIFNSTDKDRHITTGYIDREIYKTNPLTLTELYRHLGPKKAKLLESNIVNLFKYVAKAYQPHVLKYDSNKHLNFVILGCDVAVDVDLGCKIMEMNKGPDLTYKDERDKVVKYNLVKDTLHKIGLINSPNNNFIDLN